MYVCLNVSTRMIELSKVSYFDALIVFGIFSISLTLTKYQIKWESYTNTKHKRELNRLMAAKCGV